MIAALRSCGFLIEASVPPLDIGAQRRKLLFAELLVLAMRLPELVFVPVVGEGARGGDVQVGDALACGGEAAHGAADLLALGGALGGRLGQDGELPLQHLGEPVPQAKHPLRRALFSGHDRRIPQDRAPGIWAAQNAAGPLLRLEGAARGTGRAGALSP